jgi:bacterioferritin
MCGTGKSIDAGSRELLEHIPLDEGNHATAQKAYLQEIKDMGIENFLSTQVHNKEKT